MELIQSGTHSVFVLMGQNQPVILLIHNVISVIQDVILLFQNRVDAVSFDWHCFPECFERDIRVGDIKPPCLMSGKGAEGKVMRTATMNL